MPKAGPGKRPAYVLNQWFWIGVDWLFPATCGGCDKPGQRWCSTCHQQVEIIGMAVCQRCGRPFSKEGPCPDCLALPPLYESMGSWGIYGGPLRQAIHRLKYKKDIGLGDYFSRFLIDCLNERNWPVDLIIPVPLSSRRLEERGYNQADLLAWPIASALGIRYDKKGLIRVRETPSQVGLNGFQRRENVIGAFKAERSRVKGANVLIVDDVTTTGATIEECTKALLEADARQVWGLTLARATGQV